MKPLHLQFPVVLGLLKRHGCGLGRVHLIDIVHWAMGIENPSTVSYPQASANTKNFWLLFSMRFVNSRENGSNTHGIEFYSTQGTLLVDREGFTLWPEGESAAGVIHSGTSPQHYPHRPEFPRSPSLPPKAPAPISKRCIIRRRPR